MRPIAIIVAVGLLLFGLGAGSATAEITPGMFALSPSIGGYFFEGNQNLKDSLVYGLGLGYHFTRNWAAEGLFNFVDTETDPGGADVNAYLYRLEGLYHFFPDKKLVPYLAAGIGGITTDPNVGPNDTDFLADYGAGLKYFITDKIALRGDVRHVIPFDNTRNNVMVSAGLTFLFGGEAPAVQTEARAETAQVVAKAPEDSDGDGVYDAKDQCPGTPAGVKVNDVGCPLDSDGDWVYDYMDKCPGTPAGAPVDKVGCPLDSDGDGVYDYLDQHPNTQAGLKVDEYGRPILKKGEISIKLVIEFGFDKAGVRSIYHEKIKEAADFMQRYPQAEAKIGGHTDSLGSDEYNLVLSERRAKSVKNYFVDNFGISAQRFTTMGYGESQPIATNDSKEGRQKNRRAVTVIITFKEEFEKK
ncbi:MAG: outer membrane beta-barrel domain-containing protein [Desulfobacterales bacterium]